MKAGNRALICFGLNNPVNLVNPVRTQPSSTSISIPNNSIPLASTGLFGSDVPTIHSLYSLHSVRTAFSLIEIGLALGIISFALVGIIGLFPVAMKSALESQRETRAAHIAQQIFTDLSSLSGTNRFLITGTNFSTDRITVNLSSSDPIPPVYFDAEGYAMGNIAAVDATYGATVLITPNNPISGLAQVQTTVSTPTAAAETNRSSYTFVTLMNTQ